MSIKKMLLASLMMVFILTGCVQQKTDIVIHPDGKVDVTQILTVNKETAELASEQGQDVSESMLKEIQPELPDAAKAEAYQDGVKQGVKITQSFDSLTQAFNSEFFHKKNNEYPNPWKVKEKKNFFATTTTIQGEINYKEWIKGEMGLTQEEVVMMEMVGKNVELTYSITTPTKAVKQNADQVENRTYTWDIDMDEKQVIELEYHVINMVNVGIVAGGVFLGLFVLVWVIQYKRKKKQVVINEE